MSFWQKLFGGGEPEPVAKPVAAETPDTIEALPYGIADRPLPQGDPRSGSLRLTKRVMCSPLA